MIAVKFEEKEKIGLQYALETLHGARPSGRNASGGCGFMRRRNALHWRRSCTTWSRRPTPPAS